MTNVYTRFYNIGQHILEDIYFFVMTHDNDITVGLENTPYIIRYMLLSDKVKIEPWRYTMWLYLTDLFYTWSEIMSNRVPSPYEGNRRDDDIDSAINGINLSRRKDWTKAWYSDEWLHGRLVDVITDMSRAMGEYEQIYNEYLGVYIKYIEQLEILDDEPPFGGETRNP